jgi:hypothetical protein
LIKISIAQDISKFDAMKYNYGMNHVSIYFLLGLVLALKSNIYHPQRLPFRKITAYSRTKSFCALSNIYVPTNIDFGIQTQPFVSGFVSIIGNPNVGKSTLLNYFMKDKLSIVCHKPQTTRHRIQGIVTSKDYQIIFSDTPGMMNPAYSLQEAMLSSVSLLIDRISPAYSLGRQCRPEAPCTMQMLSCWLQMYSVVLLTTMLL